MKSPRLIYLRRKTANAMAMATACAMTAFGLFWLCWLLWTLLSKGASHITAETLTQPTPPPGDVGGLANAILGSLLMVVFGVLIGAPVGIMAGTWLSEYSRDSLPAKIIRFINDILLSAPSIIIGVFVYEIVVIPTGHFSGWSGALALALIALSIIVRTTEDMLNLVPNAVREAAVALGAPRWKVTITIVFRAASSGILTGILLAVARISGESAPLLFTAMNNQFWSHNLSRPIANLPVVIFQFAMSPYESWQHLAWAGALLITVGVLSLNIIARTFLKGTQNHG
jgi:phosphate transport system permease protein